MIHRYAQVATGGQGVRGEVSRFGCGPIDPLRGSARPGRSSVGRGGVGRVTDRRCFGADRYAVRPLGSVLAAVHPAGLRLGLPS